MATKERRSESPVRLILGKVEDFSQQHFDDTHAGFAFELMRRIEECTGGRETAAP